MAAMATRHYFGTDGIRGVAGELPMTADFALRVGMATAEMLRSTGIDRPHIAIGRDTRRSGSMLAQALSAGLMARGAEVSMLGVCPTPAVAYLLRTLSADVGIVISASHNPFEQNGLKFFDAAGEKFSDSLEEKLEQLLESLISAPHLSHLPPRSAQAIGSYHEQPHSRDDYLAFLQAQAPRLAGLRLAIDCANGASSAFAHDLFSACGAEVQTIHADPDGSNINVACGSTHPQTIADYVRSQGCDVGISFDGDADRVLFVDRYGRLADGDHMLAICALQQQVPGVVSTLMSNLGVEHFLAEHNITLWRAAVGDRYVHALLQSKGLTLGGEPSGHMLFLDKAPTGDGMLSALQVLHALQVSDTRLEHWIERIPFYPQVLLAVAVPEAYKAHILSLPQVQDALQHAQAQLADQGRLNVRPSGTEALIRVMAEGADADAVHAIAERLAAVVAKAAEESGDQPRSS